MRRGYNLAKQFNRIENLTFTIAVSVVLVVLILTFSYFTQPQESNPPSDTVVTTTTTTLVHSPGTVPIEWESNN